VPSEPLNHDAAINAIVGCMSVAMLSYEEAINAYFKLRHLARPADFPDMFPDDGSRPSMVQ